MLRNDTMAQKIDDVLREWTDYWIDGEPGLNGDNLAATLIERFIEPLRQALLDIEACTTLDAAQTIAHATIVREGLV